ncbi:hypothetical protein K493DRAFT_321709 [Basidiobolus meristosporus CBS 931.73]|uniref:Uncharacterized protein n=1 Tax=Basidiobolus meristosporus CBS 931.73 TaxID=1314790 RepID=A0A1Y1WPD5_9FUNG|nr:hypothetical protein K493DRAFT_321709 [Basidiobolus meristosporus CBS 931.73]|eukprot:ORX75407.1 hypothetical protein K493DRAFT_321709 [Basidiobolus meristosporus CBS 931.73]
MGFLDRFKGYFSLNAPNTSYLGWRSRKFIYKCLVIPIIVLVILTIFLLSRRHNRPVDVEFQESTMKCNAPYYNAFVEDGKEKIVAIQQEKLATRLSKCSHLKGKTALLHDPERQHFTFPMEKEFDMMLELIKCNVPLAFTRWGDGEHMLLRGQTVADGTQAKLIDGWQWTENRVGVLATNLIESLREPAGLYFYGLPCPMPWTSTLRDYMTLAKDKPTSRFSYSTLWIGENYSKIYSFFKSIQDGTSGLTQKVVLVINQSGRSHLKELYSWASHVVLVPDNCAELFEIPSARCAWIAYIQSMALQNSDTLFMVSAGPLSEALIYYMYLANPYNNQYIDFGSSLDEFGKQNNTRGYSPEPRPNWHPCPYAYGRNMTNEDNYQEEYCLVMKQVY